jgi:DNA-binding NarL/FixJ family response regulator
MDSSKIRIAVLDSNPKSRKHLVNLLGKEDDLEVVAEVGSDLAGIREVEEHKPDVILVEDKEPFTDRIENTSLVVAKFPNTRVIVLSIDQKTSMLPLHSAHNMTASSCQTWACYSLCQNCSSDEILAAIREGHLPKNDLAPKNIIQSNSFNQ